MKKTTALRCPTISARVMPSANHGDSPIAKRPKSGRQSHQQAAEEMYFLIARFEIRKDLASRSTLKTMATIFNQQCEVVVKKVTIRTNFGGNCIQTSSDLDATYDGHNGAGHQGQISENCLNENQVQLITAVIRQTACELNPDEIEPILDQPEDSSYKPREIKADTNYSGDDNA